MKLLVSVNSERGRKMALFRKSSKFIFKEMKGSSVILNGESGDYFGLKEVGTDFMKLVNGERDLDQIIMELQKIYDVDEVTLRKDIAELAEQLTRQGILIADEK